MLLRRVVFCVWGLGWAVGLGMPVTLSAQDLPAGVLVQEDVFVDAPVPACHASTLVETPQGLVAAWFGGTQEGDDDVEIWVSRHREGAWSRPVSVANGVEMAERRYPCWNPVLFQDEDRLHLFYKVGPSPRDWWGMVMTSTDDGASWSEPKRLPEGILGPIKNKPIALASGRWVAGSSTEHDGWRVHVEWSDDRGAHWQKTGPLNPRGELESIQPTLLRTAQGQLRILCRSRAARHITTATSDDEGETWSELQLSELPNNNSGLDAVTLQDGRHLLVYNHLTRGRHQLHVAVSSDGVNWQAAARLENEPGQEFSYPAVIQTADGAVHLTYTWKRRRIRHVELDLDQLQLRPIQDGMWPDEVSN